MKKTSNTLPEEVSNEGAFCIPFKLCPLVSGAGVTAVKEEERAGEEAGEEAEAEEEEEDTTISLERGWGAMEGEPEFKKMEGENTGELGSDQDGNLCGALGRESRKKKKREGNNQEAKLSPKELTLGIWVSQQGSFGMSPFSKEGRRGTGGPSCPGGLWMCCFEGKGKEREREGRRKIFGTSSPSIIKLSNKVPPSAGAALPCWLFAPPSIFITFVKKRK